MTASILKPAPYSRSRSSDSSTSSLSSTFSDIITSSTSDSSATSKTNAFFASPFSSIAKRQRAIHPSPPPPELPRLLPSTTSPATNFVPSSSNEPTPRPPNLEPTLLHFERSLLLATQEKQKWNHQPQSEPEPEPVSDDGETEEEPHPGSFISLITENHHPIPQFPLSPLALTFADAATSLQGDRGTPTNEPSSKPSKTATLSPGTPSSAYSSLPSSAYSSLPSAHSSLPSAYSSLPSAYSSLPSSAYSSLPTSPSTWDDSLSAPTLRLVRTLGHGAFSAVWLAEDLSRVPLTLVSKKSVRDLRRRVSGRDKEREREKEKEKDDKKTIQGDQELTIDGVSPKQVTTIRSPKRPPRNIRNEFKSPIVFSRSPTLADDSLSDEGGISRRSSFKLASPAVIRGDLSRDSSLKKFKDRVRGIRPPLRLGRAYLDERHGEMGWKERVAGEDRTDEVHHASRRSSRLVAVKMTPRKVRGAKGRRERAEEERMRVGFVREVEVLKHISHPNITPLLAHLSTSTHHILVLPYLPGGDLLGLVNNDVAWEKLGESVLRRIWCELCKAVGWMHGVGLVHRDIKLENILLTTPAFDSVTSASPPPTLSSLPAPPAPLIKLTDFGFSRFVEIDVNGEAELLWTRCGSEAYAAPELVIGGSASAKEGGENGRRGVYDARKTDAWACGVVLYALVARRLPFGEGVGVQPVSGGGQIGGERGGATGRGSLAERRHWLMRIARGEYEWPGDQREEESQVQVEENELVGCGLIHSQGARRIVGRLLTRDPRKRARIGDLWDDPWMINGESGGEEGWWKEKEGTEWYNLSMMMEKSQDQPGLGHEDGHEDELSLDMQGRTLWMFDRTEFQEPEEDEEEEERENGEEEEEEEEEEDGCLFDHEGIDSITRQEVI